MKGYAKVNLLQLKLSKFLSDVLRRTWLYLENIFDERRIFSPYNSCNKLTYLEISLIKIEWKKVIFKWCNFSRIITFPVYLGICKLHELENSFLKPTENSHLKYLHRGSIFHRQWTFRMELGGLKRKVYMFLVTNDGFTDAHLGNNIVAIK